jgi:hypothetical protein
MNERTQAPQAEAFAELQDIYVDDPAFENHPYFGTRQAMYRKVGRIMCELVEKGEKLDFEPEQKEVFERMFVLMSVVDLMIDNMHRDKATLAQQIASENTEIPTLDAALRHLRGLIEKHGDQKEYMSAIHRAIEYSNEESLQDRHREGLYLGKAMAAAVTKAGAQRAHLSKMLGILASLGNYADDIMDRRLDKRSLGDTVVRIRAAMREMLRLHRSSDSSYTYLMTAAMTGMTLYGRRLIPKAFRGEKQWIQRHSPLKRDAAE